MIDIPSSPESNKQIKFVNNAPTRDKIIKTTEPSHSQRPEQESDVIMQRDLNFSYLSKNQNRDEGLVEVEEEVEDVDEYQN